MNLDVVLAKRKAMAKRQPRKKLAWLGGGFLIGVCVFLFVGRTALKRGILSELPKV